MESLPREIAPRVLVDGDFLSHLWCPRLGRANSHRVGRRSASVAHLPLWPVGFWGARRVLRGHRTCHLRRPFFVYAHSNTRCHVDVEHLPDVLGVSAGNGSGRAAIQAVGSGTRGEPRHWRDAQGPNRIDRGWRRSFCVPRYNKAAIFARNLAALHVVSGIAIFLLIAVPWHVIATLRMPPYLVFTMRSAPGEYHGFFWFYFMNEHFLRFLNLRYPRDYNTVPRPAFWLLHLVWLFPWSVYFPAVARQSFRPLDRAGRTRLLALCWAGFLLVFFTFSTTQEYYSMPIYPALALLLGSAMATENLWTRWGTRVLAPSPRFVRSP